MNTPIVLLEGDQLEIDFSKIDFDNNRPQFSICPNCSSDVIKLADGCRICGWSENQSKKSDTSDKCSRKKIHPSKNCSRKTTHPSKIRRQKGGAINSKLSC